MSCVYARVSRQHLTGCGKEPGVNRTIGIDLGVTSMSRIAVAEGATIMSNSRVRSTPAALTNAIRAAFNGEPLAVVVESTAMAWFIAAVAAKRAQVPHTLYRVAGHKAAALRSFYRLHTKTDRIDAPVLARMPLVDDSLHAFELPTASELALKRLITFRQKLVQEATRVKGRIRSLLHWSAPGLVTGPNLSDGSVRILRRWPDLRKLATAHLTTIAREGGIGLKQAQELRNRAREAINFYAGYVDHEILALEIEVLTAHLASLDTQRQRLDERIESEYEQAYPHDVIRSIPGVGPTVGSIVRAVVGDASHFRNAAAFRAYTGLVPRESSSGDSEKRGAITKTGPNLLRWALYLAADVARKHDPHLAALYRRLMVERGRHHNQALCAVATHLADRIYALLRENRPYQPRDLEGKPITVAEAKAIAASLAVDAQTRQRLRNQKRGPRPPRPRQPKAPHDATQPSPESVADAALMHARTT